MRKLLLVFTAFVATQIVVSCGDSATPKEITDQDPIDTICPCCDSVDVEVSETDMPC